MREFAIKSKRIVTPEGMVAGTVLVRDGTVAAVLPPDRDTGIADVRDVGGLVVSPGLVDCHVHINEPGRTDWEGFETATQAAAAGGITTLVDMPLNCIPVTVNAAALMEKLDAVKGKLWVDCAFWGGLIPGNRHQLEGLLNAGVMGVKAFLIDSGIEEFPPASREDLVGAMPLLARRGLPLLVHAELATHEPAYGNSFEYAAYLASRPRVWENHAIEMMIALAEATRCRTHIVHLSSADRLSAIEAAKRAGVPLTVETCPHYLTLCAEEIPDRDPLYKCAPPIRERENREELWRGLAAGTIDFIVSDHSPCTPNLKKLKSGNIQKAWGGIAGLQFGLPLVWTEAGRRGFSLDQLAHWLSGAAADFLGLGSVKGRIAPGYDADLVVWDPDAVFTLARDRVRHRHKATPYLGRTLFGLVRQTYVRGNLVYQEDRAFREPLGLPILNPSRAMD